MKVFKSIYPFNQQVLEEYPLMDDAAIDTMLVLSAKAYQYWSLQNFEQRAAVLNNCAMILRRDKETLGTLITNEMGKVIKEAIAEVEKCATVCEYYATHAETFLQDEIIEAGYYKSLVTYQPIGAVLAIMPWNFPFWQVFRYAAPTLMVGNVTLLKHAPNVCGCAFAIEKIFAEAGAAEGVFQSLVIDNAQVEKIIASDIVQAVTLTGSERAGSSVAALAGKYTKKSLMELGGSDALIVLPDADMKMAATVAVQSRMQNAGQSCIASKRFIVVKEGLYDFLHYLHYEVKELKQGDPFKQGITTGPVARLDLAEALDKQLKASVQQGAHLDYGGIIDGCNFKPSLLLNVHEDMPAFKEETFGPLAAVITAKNEAEAIALANHSSYGLGGSVWTSDVEKGIAVAKQITTGAVFINSLVKSDARLPFGGVKKSGYGRELGRHGILEFVNAKNHCGAEIGLTLNA